jgi:hypothetical protein
MQRVDCNIVDAEAWLAAAGATVTPVPLPDTSGLPYERLAATYEPYVARVTDALLLPGNWLLLSERRELLCEHLHQTLHAQPHSRAHHFAAVDGRRVILDLEPAAARIDEPCVLLGGSPSYYHWLVEFLPRAYAASLLPELRGLKLVVDTGLTPVQEVATPPRDRRGPAPEDRSGAQPSARSGCRRCSSSRSASSAALHWLHGVLDARPPQAGQLLFVSRRGASLDDW